MRKYLSLLVLAVFAFALMAPFSGTLPGRMELFVKNPLLLSANPNLGRAEFKFGRNNDPDPGDDVWNCSEASVGGPANYPYQTSPFTLYISSSNAGDVQDVIVVGLDQDWNRQVITVTLAGQTFTQVAAANGWRRVFRAFNNSTAAFLGNIYLGLDATGAAGVPTNVATTLQACIEIGDGQTLMALYTSAADEESWVTQICTTVVDTSPATAGQAVIVSQARDAEGNKAFRISGPVGLTSSGSSTACREAIPPFYVPSKTDLRLRVESQNNIDSVAGTYDLVIVKK